MTHPYFAVPRPRTIGLTVRAMTAADLPFVARQHAHHLPGGFFADLGEGFLRTYYLSFIGSPASVALIAEVGGVPAGFLVGTIDHRAHSRYLGRYHRTRLATSGGVALLRRPGLTGKLVRTRLGQYLGALRRAAGPTDGQDFARRFGVLTALAVDTDVRRSGAGRALVTTYLKIAGLYGAERLELVSRPGSTATELFYPQLGWQRLPDVIDRDGRTWVPFEFQLPR